MTEATMKSRGEQYLDAWLAPRAGSGEVGHPDRRAGGCGWPIRFGSGEKYVWVTDEVLSDPYLLRLATMRLERSGWIDEPGTEELSVDGTWARAVPPQLRWVNPDDGVTYGVTFWSSGLGAVDRATFTPIAAAPETDATETQGDDFPEAEPAEDRDLTGVPTSNDETSAPPPSPDPPPDPPPDPVPVRVCAARSEDLPTSPAGNDSALHEKLLRILSG